MAAQTDFHLRIQVDGSYYNIPESKTDWGGGGLIDFEILGHSDIRMTMRYAHLSPEAHDAGAQ